MSRPVIYVAGPFRARPDVKDQWKQEGNIRQAEDISWHLLRLGAAPVCPHTMTRFFQGSLPDEVFLEADLDIIRKCDALFLMPRWLESSGTQAELDLAQALGIPILLSLKEAEEYVKTRLGLSNTANGVGGSLPPSLALHNQ